VTASTAYTLDQTCTARESGRTRGKTTSEYGSELRGMFAHAAIGAHFLRAARIQILVRPFQPSY
jgi:hypothetical protein